MQVGRREKNQYLDVIEVRVIYKQENSIRKFVCQKLSIARQIPHSRPLHRQNRHYGIPGKGFCCKWRLSFCNMVGSESKDGRTLSGATRSEMVAATAAKVVTRLLLVWSGSTVMYASCCTGAGVSPCGRSHSLLDNGSKQHSLRAIY